MHQCTLEKDIEALGRRYASENVIAGAQDDIERIARQYLLGAELDGYAVPTLQGVSDTPQAINRFTRVARSFTRTVRSLPERMRWQLELALGVASS